jgi:filamentous hemagglutinin family protein
MKTLTVTAKGQLTLSKDVLDGMGIRPGSKVSVDILKNGKAVLTAVPSGDISEFFGILKHRGKKRLSIAKINEITAKGWAGEL